MCKEIYTTNMEQEGVSKDVISSKEPLSTASLFAWQKS